MHSDAIERWRAPEKHHWTLIGPPAVCLQSKQVCGWCIQHGTALHPAASGQTRDVHCSHQIQSASRSDGGSASRDKLYSSYSPECQRSPGHVDEPQRGPRHQDSHQKKSTGTSWALTIWLCCSWNKLLVRLAGGELPPDWAWFLPRVFLHCHRWSFGSLLLSSLTCLVGDT